jgi:hypothetical protein
MTVGLGKIAQHAAAQRINLFGEQAHVVAARKQTVEQLAGFRIATLQYVVIDKPEAAREKSAFVGWQAIAGIVAFVAKEEFAIDQQAVLDRSQRPADARIGSRKKPTSGISSRLASSRLES